MARTIDHSARQNVLRHTIGAADERLNPAPTRNRSLAFRVIDLYASATNKGKLMAPRQMHLGVRLEVETYIAGWRHLGATTSGEDFEALYSQLFRTSVGLLSLNLTALTPDFGLVRDRRQGRGICNPSSEWDDGRVVGLNKHEDVVVNPLVVQNWQVGAMVDDVERSCEMRADNFSADHLSFLDVVHAQRVG